MELETERQPKPAEEAGHAIRHNPAIEGGTHETVADVYEPLVQQGQTQLERSSLDLAISGLIAGLDIGFGPLAMAVVAGRLHAAFHLSLEQAILFGSLFYPLGFVLVIMGKSELFTENTLAPVAGVLTGSGTLSRLARSWVIILGSNIAGTIIFSLIVSHTGLLFTPYKDVYRSMGTTLVTPGFLQGTLLAIFGGWLIALIAWMIETTRGSIVHFIEIYIISYLLVGLMLLHSVIGNIEVLLAMFAGAPISWTTWLGSFLGPAVLGNAIGGVVFVTALKGFQSKLARASASSPEEEQAA